MGSGKKYHRFNVLIRVDRVRHFYKWNISFMVFALGLVNIAALGLSVATDLGDRLAFIVTILLTMQALKYTTNSHLPSKPYFTWIDKQILVSFLVPFVTLMWSIL